MAIRIAAKTPLYAGATPCKVALELPRDDGSAFATRLDPMERLMTDAPRRPKASHGASASASAAGPTSPGATTSFRQGLPHSQELRLRQPPAHRPSRSTAPTTAPSSRRPSPTGATRRPTISCSRSRPIRFATNRKLLATAGESIERFVDSGIGELGRQARPARLAVHADQAVSSRRTSRRFLALLPSERGRPARCAMCSTCATRVFCRRVPGAGAPFRLHHRAHRSPTSFRPSPTSSSDLAYIRLMRSARRLRYRLRARAARRLGARRARLDRLQRQHEVFVFFINGAKERAPAAALELIRRLS